MFASIHARCTGGNCEKKERCLRHLHLKDDGVKTIINADDYKESKRGCGIFLDKDKVKK